MSGQVDHYQVLGVARDATADQIRTAFKALAAEHPDLLPAWASPEVRVRRTAAFAAISEAHAVLSDPARRAKYDAARAGAGADGSRTVEDLSDLLGFGREITSTLVALQAPGEDPRQFAGRFAAAAAEDAFRAVMRPDGRQRVLDLLRRLGGRRPAAPG